LFNQGTAPVGAANFSATRCGLNMFPDRCKLLYVPFSRCIVNLRRLSRLPAFRRLWLYASFLRFDPKHCSLIGFSVIKMNHKTLLYVLFTNAFNQLCSKVPSADSTHAAQLRAYSGCTCRCTGSCRFTLMRSY